MPGRFSVTYRIVAATLAEAEVRADDIAVEQTVEVPRDVVPPGPAADIMLGRVETVQATADGVYAARLSYSEASAADSLPQLLNVIFGNSSLQPGLRVEGLDLSDGLRRLYPGARFGIDGLRRRSGRERGGLLCPVLKPMGQSIVDLARLAETVALAGADIVKEDHGLAGQPTAPFGDRVSRLADAVARANAARRARGLIGQALYFPNITGPSDQLRDRAFQAKAAGADGLLMIPGLTGFDALRALAMDESLDLPVMAHPAFLGAHVLSPDHGIAHQVLFGTFMRLSGADISVFPNHGGRFAFSQAQCHAIVAACRAVDGPGRAILPSPGGGMTPERLPELAQSYGEDTVFLLGGSLLRAGAGLAGLIGQLRDLLDKAA